MAAASRHRCRAGLHYGSLSFSSERLLTDRYDSVAQPRGTHIRIQATLLCRAALFKTVLAELLHVPLVVASQGRHAVHKGRRARALIGFERDEGCGLIVCEGHLPKVGADFNLFGAAQKSNHWKNQVKRLVQADCRILSELGVAMLEPFAIFGKPDEPTQGSRSCKPNNESEPCSFQNEMSG